MKSNKLRNMDIKLYFFYFFDFFDFAVKKFCGSSVDFGPGGTA
jgi:hypothetical protein